MSWSKAIELSIYLFLMMAIASIMNLIILEVPQHLGFGY